VQGPLGAGGGEKKNERSRTYVHTYICRGHRKSTHLFFFSTTCFVWFAFISRRFAASGVQKHPQKWGEVHVHVEDVVQKNEKKSMSFFSRNFLIAFLDVSLHGSSKITQKYLSKKSQKI
jgi:hypothetical protein